MLDETLATCRQIADGLGSQAGASQAWEDSITDIVDKFGEIGGTFFFKTMLAVPTTRACQRDAAALLELRNAGDWAGFGPGVERLIGSAQSLIERAGMKGTTLT